MQSLSNIAGLVLAGGASSRFGAPKPKAILAGATLGAIAVKRLSALCAEVAVAGPVGSVDGDVVYLSDPTGMPRGPLAGILAGLEWAEANSVEWLAVSPCDMPLLPRGIHLELYNAASSAKASLALTTADDGPCPLCAIWSTSLASTVRQRLSQRHPPVWKLAEELGAASVSLSDQLSALNINAPSDLIRAASLQELHWWNASTN